MEELGDVDKLCGVLHMAWGVSEIFPEQLCQILGQVLGSHTAPGETLSVTFVPYMSMTFSRISRLLSWYNFKSVGLFLKKIPIFLCPVKDDLGLKTRGVCCMPCKCGQVYIRQTRLSIKTRIKEPCHHISLEQPDVPTMANHSINLGYHIKLQGTTILSTNSRYIDWMIREAIEIQLHTDNMNREDGLCLNW
jgi:hypothetical protein